MEKKGKTSYPVLTDPDGTAAELGRRIINRANQIDALKSEDEIDKADLKAIVIPFYFETNRLKAEVPSSISVAVPILDDKRRVIRTDEVLVTCSSRYSGLPDETTLVPILGDNAATCLRQSLELKIDGDKLPVGKEQALLDELQGLFQRYNATDAISVKSDIKPAPDFHVRRHSILTPDQNLAFQNACPFVTMVKVKGRK